MNATTELRNPEVATTMADVFSALELAREMAARYLDDQGVPRTVDGFHATALSGDEDPDTIRRYTTIYGPLKGLILAMDAIRHDSELGRLALDSDPTWHSRQWEVLACTGEESDERIASIYRDSLRS